MNYEKVKFANGAIYDLVPGGFVCTEDTLKIIFQPGEKTLSQIDEETDNATNTERIELLDTLSDVLDIKKGYVYQAGCEKKKNYVIGREEIETGTDAGGSPARDYHDVTDTVVIITLEKSNIRKELDDMKETVDLLVISSLGV